MQNHNFLNKFFCVVLCFLMTNCATTNAPSDWLSEPEQIASNGYGGWVDIKARESHIAGELIAISTDTVFVADREFHAVCSKDILSARLVTYDASSMAVYVILGTLLTISNGGFLIITAPMWLIGGSIAAASRSYDPIIDYPEKSLANFKPFARYPQGLPPDLDRGMIMMKPHK